MSIEFDVFVSYSRRDIVFARQLVAMLSRAGLRVWLDEEQIRSGDEVLGGLVAGLEKACHAIFIVTEDWLASDWTKWELESFLTERSAERRVVPILRMEHDPRKLGPVFSRLHFVKWLAGEVDRDARFWEVYCGLGLASLGPRRHWSEKGRRALGALAGPVLNPRTHAEEEALAVRRAQTNDGRLALTCNRAPQWGELIARMATPRDEALFVRGMRRQGHEFFLERIRQCLPKDPRRRIRTVKWGPLPPMARGPMMDHLAATLRCRADQLVATVRSQLADQNLVLLHRPVLEFSFENEALASYYLKWLPELIRKVDSGPEAQRRHGGLKVVQALSWRRTSRIKGTSARALRLFGVDRPEWIRQAMEQEDATHLLESLRHRSKSSFPVVLLEELSDLTRQDVENWSSSLSNDLDRQRFVDVVLSDFEDSADIFQRIVERLSAAY